MIALRATRLTCTTQTVLFTSVNKATSSISNRILIRGLRQRRKASPLPPAPTVSSLHHPLSDAIADVRRAVDVFEKELDNFIVNQKHAEALFKQRMAMIEAAKPRREKLEEYLQRMSASDANQRQD